MSLSRLSAIAFCEVVVPANERDGVDSSSAQPARLAAGAAAIASNLAAEVATDRGGQIIRQTDRAILVEFETCSMALGASVAWHRAALAYGHRPDAGGPIRFRVGIGVGEVDIDDAGDNHRETRDIIGVRNQGNGGLDQGGKDSSSAASGSSDSVIDEALMVARRSGPGQTVVTDLVKALGEFRFDHDFVEASDRDSRQQGATPFSQGPVYRVVDNVSTFNHLELPHQLVASSQEALIGRVREKAMLIGTCRAAAGGTAGTVLLAGEPGIGKSRLVEEVGRHAHRDGFIVLYGSCEPDIAVPYRPFSTALRPAIGLDDDLAKAVALQEGELARLFPRTGAQQDTEAGEVERVELFSAAGALLSRLAQLQPVLLILDDLHWATDSTVALLQHLITNVGQDRLQLLGTYRHGEVDHSHPLARVIADATPAGDAPGGEKATDASDPVADPIATETRAGGEGGEPAMPAGARRLTLPGLEVAEVVELFAAHLGGSLDATATELARRVHGASRGSPFFTRELFRHLGSTGELRNDNGVWTVVGNVDGLPIPTSVREVLAQRLVRLGPDLTSLLSIASVIGPSFSLDLLGEVSDLAPERIESLIEESVSAALALPASKPRQFEFVHAIVRSALTDEIKPTRRSIMHLHIAEALEHLDGGTVDGAVDRDGRGESDEVIDQLAYHWPRAMTKTPAKAIHYLGIAAERDLAALAWDTATLRYRQVIELSESDPAATDTTRARNWLGLGYGLRSAGNSDYRSAMATAGGHAQAANRHDLIARAAIGHTKPGLWFPSAGEILDNVIELCTEALEGLGPDQEPLRLLTLCTLATNLAFDHDRDHRITIVAEALDIAERLNDPVLTANALIAEFLALWDSETFERRRVIADRLLELGTSTGESSVSFLGGFFRAHWLVEGGDVHGGRAQLFDLDDIIAATRSYWFEFLTERFVVAIDIFLGDPGAAAHANDLFARSADTQADGIGTWAAHMGTLAVHGGRVGSIRDSLQDLVDGRNQNVWCYPLAMALYACDEAASAEELLDATPEPALNFWHLASLQMLGEVSHDLGRTQACEWVIGQLSPYRGRIGLVASGTLLWGLVSTSFGEAALGAGQLDLSIEALNEAIPQADAVGSPYCAARSRRLLAEALLAARDHQNRDHKHQENGDSGPVQSGPVGSPDPRQLLGDVLDLADEHGFAGEHALATRTLAMLDQQATQ